MYFAPSASLVRRSLTPSLRGFDRQFDRTFAHFIQAAVQPVACQPGAPLQARLSEDDQAYTLTLDVPGIAREHLTVGIEDQTVTVGTVEQSPRTYRFQHELPVALDASVSEARLEHGVLTLRLVKQPPVSRVTPINVL